MEAVCQSAGITEEIPHTTHLKLAKTNKWLLDQYYRNLLETFLADLYDKALERMQTDGGASPGGEPL